MLNIEEQNLTEFLLDVKVNFITGYDLRKEKVKQEVSEGIMQINETAEMEW